MSPRQDPFKVPEASHVLDRQVYDQLASIRNLLAQLADRLTATNGELVDLRRAVENRQAVAENCRLNAKRRWHKENSQ